MGHLAAVEFAEHAPNLEIALRWHLQSNHYPPVPSSLIPACIEAIEAYDAEDYEQLIKLPEGILWKGYTKAPAGAIIDTYNLHAFLADE
jgi:hypothetical protein